MLKNYLEKKLSKLGYIKASEFDLYKEGLTKEVRETLQFKRPVQVKEIVKEVSNVYSDEKFQKLEKRVEKTEQLFEAVFQIRQEQEKYKSLPQEIQQIKKELKAANSDIHDLKRSIKELVKANSNITKIEKAYRSFETLENIEKRIEMLDTRLTGSLEKNSASMRAISKQIQDTKDKLSKIRINGYPLTPHTTLRIIDLDTERGKALPLIQSLSTKFEKDLEDFENSVSQKVEQKLKPHEEKEKKLEALDEKVNKLTSTNRKAGELIKQKSFEQLYKETLQRQKLEK